MIVGPWTNEEKSKALYHHLEQLREELKPEGQGRALVLSYHYKLQAEIAVK